MKGPFVFVLGPVLVLAIMVLMNLTTGTSYYIPNPISLLTLTTILISVLGGARAGLVTALSAAIYLAFHLNTPGETFSYTDADSRRLIAWSVCFAVMAMVIGTLKSRNEASLQREVEILHQQEEEMRANERRTRAIIDSAYDAFIAMDKAGHVVEWNLQAERTFGYSRDEALGQALSELIVPDAFKEAHRHGLTRYLQTGEAKILNRRIEVPARHKSGRPLVMELTVYPIHQNDGVLFGAFLHDVSERKRLEQLAVIQLKASQLMNESSSLDLTLPSLLKELCRGSGWNFAEIWLYDRTHQSFSCQHVWSVDKELQSFFEIQNPAHLSVHQALAGKPLNDGAPEWLDEIDNRPVPRSGLFRAKDIKTMFYCAIHDREDVIGILAMYHSQNVIPDMQLVDLFDDFAKRLGLFITRIRSEQDLKELSHQLEQKVRHRTEELNTVNQRLRTEAIEKEILYEQARTANRLKDEFLATISHELRTPMNVILGHSELLHEEGLTPLEQKKSIEAIYRNTKAQVHIVSDILDVSKFITGKVQMNMEVVNMGEVITSAVESIMQTASAKDIQISESVSTDVGMITGDPTRLHQVMWNLLSNAIKFTPRHGHIHVSLTSAESNIIVTVKDDGKGIDPAFLPYVFERFRQEDSATTRKFGGLGLGLAITKNIVEAHGGSIQASSKGKGSGTTMSVILPITTLRVYNHPEAAPEDFTTLLNGLHIVVVDDQEDALGLVVTLLKRAGAQVTKATSATEAFKKVIRLRPDVLISDIGMPEKDGYDLIGMIRKLPPEMGGNTLALALTAYAQEEDQRKTKEHGFQQHLAKPVEGKTLIRAVAKLAGRYPPSDH